MAPAISKAPLSLGATFRYASRRFAGDRGLDWVTGSPISSIMCLRTTILLKGGDAGEGWDAKQAGDNLYGRITDLERLASRVVEAARLEADAIGAAADEGPLCRPDPGQTPGPEHQSLTGLQKAMQPNQFLDVAEHIAAPLAGAALGGAEGYFNQRRGRTTG